ncbi:putative Cactus-binding C-terminus of cactin protein [Leishmania utingensis]|uniref:Cactus-binding C-terminus of cactin protein n=1 Tax=Leishmania utingensis TaxID=653362 RepID=A0AAW3AAF0_9TRYP
MDWDRPSGKRRRTDEEEACEALGGLLRQTASRAMERVRLQRQQRGWESQLTALSSSAAAAVARSVKPMDVLVIRFCMHYLDCSTVAAPNQFVRLAQEVVTSSIERLLVPQLFSRDGSSLPALCESLVTEHTAEDIQVTVKEVSEFVEARCALGAWIADATATRGDVSEDDNDDADNYTGDYYDHSRSCDHGDGYSPLANEEGEGYEDGDGGRPPSPQQDGEGFALAATLYQACEFWVRVQTFLNSLSLHSARLHVFAMPPRYERELLLLLYAATRGGGGDGDGEASTETVAPGGGSASRKGKSRGDAPSLPASTTIEKVESKDSIKPEPMWDGDEDVVAQVVGVGGTDNESTEQTEALTGLRQPQQLYKASALLADVLALSRCPEVPTTTSSLPIGATSAPALVSSPSSAAAPRISAEAMQHLRGLNSNFYKMVYARLGVMVARDRLYRFDQVSAITPPELTVQQRNLQEQLIQQEQQQRYKADLMSAALGIPGQPEAGLPAAYVPDDAYYEKLLHQQHDTIDEDEEVYKGEVMDYYLSHPNRPSAATGSSSNYSRSRSHHGGSSARGGEAEALMKPHRFCKVKTGFTWTQYNRTHYDSRTNPPPRTEMWYEFTLFYPALANTKRDMRHIFRIEDTPDGPNDQYCLLVFSVGPPYADVAYRIRKKQWDPRRGGVRISFDQYGRYKLFFRFTNSNYRR